MRLLLTLTLVIGTLSITACGSSDAQPESAVTSEPIVGLPCEGCEGVFVGIPDRDTLTSGTRIAPEDEPGEPLTLTGTVRDQEGNPAEGIIVYAYHTDAEGIYPRPANPTESDYPRHGTLRAWTKTAADGTYTFHTIRPASYPHTTIPQHIHMHIIEPAKCTYYIDDVHFEDDPHLTERMRKRSNPRAGSGTSMPTKDESGDWTIKRDITLGLHIPGYPAQKD